MSTRTIFVEPSDVWLFRDGRPFAAGEQARAASIFPPTPRTVQGMIRSARLTQSGASFTDQQTWSKDVGTPEDFGDLTLRGPVLARRKEMDRGEGSGSISVERYFPLPADVARLSLGGVSGWQALVPRDDRRIKTNLNTKPRPKEGEQRSQPQLLLPPDNCEPQKFGESWLDEDGLLAYLRGDGFDAHVHPVKDEEGKPLLYEREPRLGIQIESKAKRTAEGKLYQVEFIRLAEGVGLLVEVAGVELDDTGLVQLGGEARAGRYKTAAGTSFDLSRDRRLTKRNDARRRFKLYLATPAIFEGGWLPGAFERATLSGTWQGIELTLVSAAIGKPQPIGGRNIASRDDQRKIQRAVPAGSVYFFETEARAEEVFGKFDGRCISDVDATIGFGLCYVGGW